MATRRDRDGGSGLGPAPAVVRTDSDGAHPRCLAVRRPAPDRGHRPITARRTQGDHPRRADRRPWRGPDRGGARSDRTTQTPRPRRRHDQPQHGGRPRGCRPHRRAPARPQQRRVRRQDGHHRATGGRDHRRFRQCGHPPPGPRRSRRSRRRRRSGDMMTATPTTPSLDRTDERLRHDAGFGGTLRSFWRSVKAGDVGVLPVVLGLLVICTIFQSLNPIFLSSANLVNLTLDSCAVGIISLGIVCVLLVGEIDLSVGSVSGLSGAIVGVLFVREGWNWMLAVALACAVALLIGLIYGIALTRFGMPSFVASLSGLLAFLGLQLAILGDQGSVNLPFDSTL